MHLQLSAMDRILRPLVAGGDGPRLAPDQLAEFVEVAQALVAMPVRASSSAKPKLGQLAHGGRLQIDADAERRELAHGFIDADRDAGLMQAERQAEPANSCHRRR